MADAAEITKMRNRLRISSDSFDTEIGEKMDFADAEMIRRGILTTIDDLVRFSCEELYVKGAMNFEGAADRYTNAFDEMTKSLSLSTGYQDV